MCHMYFCTICTYVPYMYHMYHMCHICTSCFCENCHFATSTSDLCSAATLILMTWKVQMLAKVGNAEKHSKMKSKKWGFRTQGQSLVVQKRLVEEEGMVKARDLRPVSSKSAFSCRQKSASKDKISKDQLCAKVLSCCAAQQENPFKLLPLSTNTNGSWVLCWCWDAVAYLVSS